MVQKEPARLEANAGNPKPTAMTQTPSHASPPSSSARRWLVKTLRILEGCGSVVCAELGHPEPIKNLVFMLASLRARIERRSA